MPDIKCATDADCPKNTAVLNGNGKGRFVQMYLSFLSRHPGLIDA